uniref:Ribosomal protein S4 n=4 Tax=IRL clade TaxID=2233839 RepID=A0A6H0QXS2_9FABA|nr:ribosomal protein S4 [Trifolium meduseum]YP_009827613.1 ribosomal protein S4 [Trifolium meduseum]YP_010578429.1 ribosomal protein S10 [Pisum sativum subsp. elatius]QKS31870.1 ribosomal protein S10 [Vavilovia formosa]QTC06362.1 ribosomal protein S10 [Pisum sativum subsp. sativum]QIV67055.1 ribosomal protein S4 [Trifolium meduseum]QIV67056.1 ribosomal protein S4 [Trifolium meduseum]QTC06394.1 ribosomal protein S10 [Pisum sativum subsp. sativum]
MTTKIRIVIRSFDHPFLENHFGGLPPYTRKIGLPESRVLYTVLRSPHIDKKSREQFEMEIKKKYLVIKTEKHELRKKFFRLKRQRLFGAQYEILFFCKTRSDKGKLQRLLRSKILALTLS